MPEWEGCHGTSLAAARPVPRAFGAWIETAGVRFILPTRRATDGCRDLSRRNRSGARGNQSSPHVCKPIRGEACSRADQRMSIVAPSVRGTFRA